MSQIIYVTQAGLEELRKEYDKLNTDGTMRPEMVRDREELSEQIKALKALKQMAASYGFDISKPASNAKEAMQWAYFGYLAGAKENNGAATSMGRNATFFDIYIERDLAEGTLTEEEAQELIDQFVIKLRLARHLRTPDYDELFSGDPTWVTCSIGGVSNDNLSMVPINKTEHFNLSVYIDQESYNVILENKDSEHVPMFAEQLYDLALLSNQTLSTEAMQKFVKRSNDIMLLIAK